MLRVALTANVMCRIPRSLNRFEESVLNVWYIQSFFSHQTIPSPHPPTDVTEVFPSFTIVDNVEIRIRIRILSWDNLMGKSFWGGEFRRHPTDMMIEMDKWWWMFILFGVMIEHEPQFPF
jgi:hypothetical protein